MWYFALILLAAASSSIQAYKAAVVHYYPTTGSTPTKTILKNVNEYRKFVAKAKRKDVDIIVFPEYGLVTTSGLAAPGEYAINIENSTIITELSEIASENHIYLVVNLFEKIGDRYYNADLVFDRNGTIIIKFHKMHLFNEYGLTPGLPNQTNVFTTDFGVTFGIFTCFDILFLNPAQTVLNGTNVTDVVFVTGWLPSFVSLSIEQGYSFANKVNLLAANYGRSYDGRSGTGIHLADGKTAKLVTEGVISELVTLEVPPIQKEKEECLSKVSRSIQVTSKSKYKFHDVDLKQNNTRAEVCNRQFCCTFDISLDPQENSSDIYKLMVYDDSVLYNTIKADFHICSLVACQNDSINSCGAMTTVTTKFRKISVKGHFSNHGSSFHRPITLSTSVSPLKQIKYCDNDAVVELRTKNQEEVLAFGLFERKDTEIEAVDDFANFHSYVMLFWGRPYYYPLFTTF